MDKKPSVIVDCDGCDGDGEWLPIVWDINEDGADSLDWAREAFVSVCPECGLILELSLGYYSVDVSDMLDDAYEGSEEE